MEQLRAANPAFFSDKWEEYGEFKSHHIEPELGEYVLKLETHNNTFPVYSIDQDTLTLEYLRHGWTPPASIH
jgi:hypothetical protein